MQRHMQYFKSVLPSTPVGIGSSHRETEEVGLVTTLVLIALQVRQQERLTIKQAVQLE